MRFSDNVELTAANMAGDDILAGTDVSVNADKKFALSGLADWFLNRFTGLSLAGSNQSVKSAVDSLKAAVGSPLVASTAAAMTDTTKVYVYTGSETGYTNGNWYYYSGSAWVSGGVYNAVAVATDTTLSVSGVPADAAAVGRLKEGVVNKINSVKNIVALEADAYTTAMLENKVLSAAGVVTNASGTSYKVTDYIPVEEGWCVSYKYSRARWGNQNWAFYDADKNVVSTYGKSSSATSVEYCIKLIVPFGAKYFVLARDENGISNEPDSDIAIIKKYCESIDKMPKSAVMQYADGSMTETALSATNSSGKLIGSAGLLTNTSSADYRVSVVTVTDGDVVNVRNCQARYSNKMYAFYDASDLPINVLERSDNNAHDYIMLEVPFGAVKLAVSGYQSYATVSKVTKLTVASSAWADKKWACMGDSITDADNARATKRYFDYIQDETGISVVNLGKSGTGYMKAYNSNLPFYQRVDTIPLDSDVITIFGSGNDCSLTLGNVTDTGTDTVCGCINNTIDGIRARIVGANIGIISPTPWEQYPTYTTNSMGAYCDALGQICKLKGVPFLDLYRCSNMLPWEQAFREAFYTHDDGNGTHPDENGHRFFAPHIKAFLETLLM